MKRQMAGYTILEVMIFLAVSGLLFAAVYPSWSNRQDKVQFSQSVQDLNNKISDVINDVSTGYFPNSNFNCNVAGMSGNIVFPNNPQEQGTRRECVFLGKVIHFNGNDTDDAEMNIFTVVGKNEGSEVNTKEYNLLNPTAVARDNGGNAAARDITETYDLKWGVRVTKVVVSALPTPVEIGSIAMFSPLESDNLRTTSGSNVKQVNILPVTGSAINTANHFAASDINDDNAFQAANINPPNGIIICLTDNDGDQQAAILVGGLAGSGKTRLTIEAGNIITTYGGAVCD